MEATIYVKAARAIETFLDRKGYNIIERGWAHGSDRAGFIAREDGDLVFATAKISEGSGGFPEEGPTDREGLERLAAAYLEHFDEDDIAVRFDIVSMMVLGDSRGFLRLHRNALSALQRPPQGAGGPPPRMGRRELQHRFRPAREPRTNIARASNAWEQRKLGELCSINSGRDYKHLDEGDIPVFGTGGFMTSVNEALSYDRDAVGIGRKGTIDKPYKLRAPFWTVDTLFYCIPEESVDLDFLEGLFLNVDWASKDESTGLPSLSKTIISDVEVLVPKLSEQVAISGALASLDSLITLHLRAYRLRSCKRGRPRVPGSRGLLARREDRRPRRATGPLASSVRPAAESRALFL